MWFSSSAGVSTSLSSIKSTSSACKTSASTKCPMRTLAITGMVTVFMISRMILMDAMRATPPSLRMSDGTRSSAITAQAPAFSAICACSALVTSIITPPLSISAKPTFTRHSFAAFPFPLPFTFFTSMSRFLLSRFSPRLPRKRLNFLSRRFTDNHKSSFASRQYISHGIPDLADVEQAPALVFRLPALHDNFFLHADRLQILDGKFRGYRAHFAKPANLPHGFIQQRGDNSAVPHPTAALIPLAQNKSPNDAALLVVLHKGQLHPVFVRATTPEAMVGRIRCQRDRRQLSFLCALCALHCASFVLNPSQTSATLLRSARLTPRCRFRISIRSNSANVAAPRALSNESAARWHQIRAAVPATGTSRLPDASSASLPACACAALHPAPQAAQRTPCAFSRHAWKTFHGAETPRGSPAPTDRCECPWSVSPRAGARWPPRAPRSIPRAVPETPPSQNYRC